MRRWLDNRGRWAQRRFRCHDICIGDFKGRFACWNTACVWRRQVWFRFEVGQLTQRKRIIASRVTIRERLGFLSSA